MVNKEIQDVVFDQISKGSPQEKIEHKKNQPEKQQGSTIELKRKPEINSAQNQTNRSGNVDALRSQTQNQNSQTKPSQSQEKKPTPSVQKSNEIGWFGQESVVSGNQRTQTPNQQETEEKEKKFFANPSLTMKKVEDPTVGKQQNQKPKSMNVVDLKDL